jgi:hypothetical protein
VLVVPLEHRCDTRYLSGNQECEHNRMNKHDRVRLIGVSDPEQPLTKYLEEAT